MYSLTKSDVSAGIGTGTAHTKDTAQTVARIGPPLLPGARTPANACPKGYATQTKDKVLDQPYSGATRGLGDRLAAPERHG